MNGNIKLKSKYLLTDKTFRFFSISALSILLRRGILALYFVGISIFLKSTYPLTLIDSYGEIPFYTAFFIIGVFFLFFILLFSSALRLGEQFAFFIRAQGGTGRFFILFHFLPFKKCIKALWLYLKLNFLKTLWFIYFITPCVLCGGIIFYVYTYSQPDTLILIILSGGFSLLFSVSVFMWRITCARYNAAPYYLCLNTRIKIKKAIKKSIRHTDGYLKESVLLESSFAGWLLSCLLIIPVFYVLPYFRLSKSVFINHIINEKEYTKASQPYAVNYLKMNPEKSN